MNDPITKEEALILLNQLQSKFSISKKDINESFNKSIEDGNSNNRTPNTKIRLITVDEALFKIIIPWNKDKRWKNNKENYPTIAFHDNRWFIYWNYDWPSTNIPNLNHINMAIRLNSSSPSCGGFLSEYNYSNYSAGDATAYQDNYRDSIMIRIYNEGYQKYSNSGDFSNDNFNVPKNGIPESSSFKQPYRGFFPVISFSL